MKKRDWLYWLLALIAAGTVVGGLVQIFAPGFVLEFIGGETTRGNRHSFGIVGMFMVLFGGLLLHALLSARHHPLAVLWAGLQKLGAFFAVGLGAMWGLFAPLAWGVAFFDLLSGVLILWYWLTIK
jgi:hypothetical protein